MADVREEEERADDSDPPAAIRIINIQNQNFKTMRHLIYHFVLPLFFCLAFMVFGSTIAQANIQQSPVGAAGQMRGEADATGPDNPGESGRETGQKKIFGVLFAVAVILPLVCMVLANGRRCKCPKCGQNSLAVRSSEIVESRPSKDIAEVTYVCTDCGGEVRRRETIRAGTPVKK